MRGPEEAYTLLRDHLEARVPLAVAELAERLNLGTDELPVPQAYGLSNRSRLEPEEWPAVLVVGQDAGDVRIVDTDELAIIYSVSYRARVYVFARAEGTDFDAVSLLRYRLTLATREAILGKLIIGDRATVNPAGWRESYSEADTVDRAARSIAASFLELAVTLEESASTTELGKANTVTVHESLLTQEHPAL